MSKSEKIEKILWSIALPGLGQLLNGQLFKGLILIILEFLINVQSSLNQVIIYSFQGDIQLAIEETNYQWLMFYPCIYMYSIWDAYQNAEGETTPFSFLPFVISAYLGTIGVIYSSNLKLFGVLIGPVFLPILFIIFGIGIGVLFKMILQKMIFK